MYADLDCDQALVANRKKGGYEVSPRRVDPLPSDLIDLESMNLQRALELSRTKMASAHLEGPAIASFVSSLERIASGATGMIAEVSLEPVDSLPSLDSLPQASPAARKLLSQLAVIKLNGGLGTGMGLDKAKSLIPVRDGWNFLDFTARQILHLRSLPGGERLVFLLMNSFSTRSDTLDHLARYPDLALDGLLDFVQGKVPKVDAATLEAVSWPEDPELEWCPPGHGDLYPSLLGSGILDSLLSKGIRYLFVSNSDNLGASVDLALLEYFATSGNSFLMEVAERTTSDRKGGHLARRREDQRLILRESAQCPPEDAAAFQDIARHRFFNTNNLWIQLEDLRKELNRLGGSLPLPLIRNEKSVDPRNPASQKVLQLETAMGAAIECFPKATAVVVDRRRFAPVKTTGDLLALRSDAYRVTEDYRLELIPSRRGIPPEIDLDSRHYKGIADFERAFSSGVPSLALCDRLSVSGRFSISKDVICTGKVEWINSGTETLSIAPGNYNSASGKPS